MMAETSLRPSAKLVRSFIVMAQQESRADVRVDPAPPRGQRRPESSPPVSQSEAPWAPLTPRARRPQDRMEEKAELLENQLEVVVMREQALKAERAAAQRNAEEREQFLLERLATLERNMGICAPSAPDPELLALQDHDVASQSSGFTLVKPVAAETVGVPGLHNP